MRDWSERLLKINQLNKELYNVCVKKDWDAARRIAAELNTESMLLVFDLNNT